MKSLIISMILVTMIIIVLIVNIVYIDNITTQMLELTQKLPIEIETNIERLKEYDAIMSELCTIWEKNSILISISVNYEYLQNISQALIETYNYYTSNTLPQYLTARAVLIDNVTRLHQIESIHIQNLL